MVQTRFKAEWIDGSAHFARLRDLPCCIPGCWSFRSVVHHERRGTGGGSSYKPPSPESGINLCGDHHALGHQIGWATFEKKFGVDLQMIREGHAQVSRGMGLLPKEPNDGQ